MRAVIWGTKALIIMTAVGILIPVVVCVGLGIAASIGTSIEHSRSSESTCKSYNPPRMGWLRDYDREGEVTLWTKPALPSRDENRIAAVIPFVEYGLSVGDSIAVEVSQECLVNGILFYHVDVGEYGVGWVDVDYLYWSRPR